VLSGDAGEGAAGATRFPQLREKALGGVKKELLSSLARENKKGGKIERGTRTEIILKFGGWWISRFYQS